MPNFDLSTVLAIQIPADIPHGDMPGDKICIADEHIEKARTILPLLLPLLDKAMAVSPAHRAVVAVHGGSGVGKSEIASVLGYLLSEGGLKSYVLSGDNYPRRIPKDNDAERVRVYRVGGLRGLIDSGIYEADMGCALRKLWAEEKDADPAATADCPWLRVYQAAARRALAGYLGTSLETDFDEVAGILARFHAGDTVIPLKRMGREPMDLWYDPVDLTGTNVLLLEWTHGNSDELRGVDIPVFLYSTPEETLAHRRARARDNKVDSAFTTLVLEIEQQKLLSQAHKAKIVIAKDGSVLKAEKKEG